MHIKHIILPALLLCAACQPLPQWDSAPSAKQRLSSDLAACQQATRGNLQLDFSEILETPEVRACMRPLGHVQYMGYDGISEASVNGGFDFAKHAVLYAN